MFDMVEDDARELWMGATSALIHRDRNGKFERIPVGKNPNDFQNPIITIKKDEQVTDYLLCGDCEQRFSTILSSVQTYFTGQLPGA